MSLLLLRKVKYFQCVDYELYVELRDRWVLPLKIPLGFQVTSTQYANVFMVHSVPCPTQLFYKSEWEGFWITRNDCIQKAVFGIPLHVTVDHFPFQSQSKIMVGYHGTSLDAYKSIQASHLKSSFGQLGTGVYVGSFWKACRFAGRDQEYKMREDPIVFRVLWLDDFPITFPRLEPCLCPKCVDKDLDKAQACFHTKVWNGMESSGFLMPGKYQDGKWRTKNEEWVLNPSKILRLGEAVRLDKSTIDGPAYNPYQRNIEIM